MEDFEEGEERVGSFSIFFAEGEALAKQEQYRKAIESFTKVAISAPSCTTCSAEAHCTQNTFLDLLSTLSGAGVPTRRQVVPRGSLQVPPLAG